MSSTPVTPSAAVAHPAPPTTATVNSGIITKIEADFTWVKVHILILLITLGAVYGGVTLTIRGIDNLISKHDAAVAAEQQKIEGVDTSTQQALLAQLQSEQVQNATRDAQQNALITSLVQQMKTSQAATAKQVQVDSTADASSTASRLAVQTKASPTDVTASNDSVTMTLPVARAVTSGLDLLTQAQADNQSYQAQLQAQQILTSDAKVELQTAQDTIAAAKTELIQTVKADDAKCAADTNTAVQNQQAKDSKHNKIFGTIIFILGAVAGHGI